VTQLPEWAPADLDVTRPNAARIYDYFLGGAHNFELDRELAARISATSPGVAVTARANRHFLRRGVEALVTAGIRQFLDIGSGIPTVGNVHEVARALAPDCRVVYVDIDPVVVAQSRSILGDDPNTAALCFDLRDPQKILAEAVDTGLLRLEEPAAVLLAGIVHFIPAADEPATILEQLRDALAPGSYLLISHATADDLPPELVEAQRLCSHTSTEIMMRTRAEIASFFGPFELIEPGLVRIDRWRPEPVDEPDPHPEQVAGFAGVGRKG
jgi:SAM-dependent methyltransferase